MYIQVKKRNGSGGDPPKCATYLPIYIVGGHRHAVSIKTTHVYDIINIIYNFVSGRNAIYIYLQPCSTHAIGTYHIIL